MDILSGSTCTPNLYRMGDSMEAPGRLFSTRAVAFALVMAFRKAES